MNDNAVMLQSIFLVAVGLCCIVFGYCEGRRVERNLNKSTVKVEVEDEDEERKS